MLIRFDDVDNWAPALTDVLSPYVPEFAKERIRQALPQYIEDAADLLFEGCSRDQVVDAMLEWIRSNEIAAYHGTRLTDQEVADVRASGLVPLKAILRRTRLARALGAHALWPALEPRLDSEIEKYGSREFGGRREAQVHLTLSRAGLISSFNHYLRHGSEFDQCVARALLGDEGIDLLALDGDARVIECAVPGAVALDAAHPYFSINDLLKKDELPNLVRQFVQVWSFRQARPSYQSRKLQLDCGFIFRSTVLPDWISTIETATATTALG